MRGGAVGGGGCRGFVELDAASAQAAGPDYATRYERMRQRFAGGSVQLDEPPAPAPAYRTPAHAAAGTAGRGGAPMPRRSTAINGGGDASAWADPAEIAGTIRQPATGADQWADPDQIAATTRTATGTATRTATPPVIRGHVIPTHPAGGHTAPATGGHSSQIGQAQPVPAFVTAVIAAFAGDSRAHTIALANTLGLSQQRLSELLRGIGVRPLPNGFSRRGEYLRGYALADVEAAAQAISRGELQVPADIAAWTP